MNVEERLKEAVEAFWDKRGANGEGVRGGKTLDPFVEIIKDIVGDSSLSGVTFCEGRNHAALPGYFRASKNWDLLVMSGSELVAAIELKSQVGSIGNNGNNRVEEVLGSGFDLQNALSEHSGIPTRKAFLGYLIVVEDSEDTRKNPSIQMKNFPAMDEFIRQEGEEDAENFKQYIEGGAPYPNISGVSYLERYDLTCQRMMVKSVYDFASILTIDKEAQGEHGSVSSTTNVKAFLTALKNHCDLYETMKG